MSSSGPRISDVLSDLCQLPGPRRVPGMRTRSTRSAGPRFAPTVGFCFQAEHRRARFFISDSLEGNRFLDYLERSSRR